MNQSTVTHALPHHPSPICVCTRVGNSLHFVDPTTLRQFELSSTLYWRYPFGSICTHGGTTEYTVLDIEPLLDEHGQPITHGKVRACVAAKMLGFCTSPLNVCRVFNP